MALSPRLALPFLQPGQAQKEWFHNEALQLLDLAVAASVEGLPLATPPASPVEGECHIVAQAAVGDWSGHEEQIAGYTAGGWRFVDPPAGMRVHRRSDGMTLVFTGSAWQAGNLVGTRLTIGGVPVVGAQGAAIAEPSGGATSDPQARTAIGEILNALRTHGLIAV